MRLIQPSLRDLGNPKSLSPTLKRWAILVCPSGTRVCPGLARILWEQILAALDIGTAVLVHWGAAGYEVEFTSLDGHTIAARRQSRLWPPSRMCPPQPGDEL